MFLGAFKVPLFIQVYKCSEFNGGGQPCKGVATHPGGEKKYSQSPRATETGTRSGLLEHLACTEAFSVLRKI